MFVCFPFVLGALCHLFNKRIFDWNYINCTSGVFRILVRGKGAVGADKGAVWRRRLGSSAEKSLSMGGGQCAVGMCFDAVFNKQKTRTVTRSLWTRILQFNCEMKLTKTVQKYPKNRSQTKGGGRGAVVPSPPISLCHLVVPWVSQPTNILTPAKTIPCEVVKASSTTDQW